MVLRHPRLLKEEKHVAGHRTRWVEQIAGVCAAIRDVFRQTRVEVACLDLRPLMLRFSCYDC